MRPFPRIPPRDDCYDFNPESPNPIRPQKGSRSEPRLAGTAVAKVEAARGLRIAYQERVEYPGRDAYAEAVRRLTGLELRDRPPYSSRVALFFYESYNRVMWNAVEKDFGRDGLQKVLNEAARQSRLSQLKKP